MRDVDFYRLQARVDIHHDVLEKICVPGVRDAQINERLTRSRVGGAEDRLSVIEAFYQGGFWARLKWLLFGPVPPVVVISEPSEPEDDLELPDTLSPEETAGGVRAAETVFDPLLPRQ